MSEETVLTPITPEEGVMEPPKVTPVPVNAGTAPTVKLKPVIRKPMIRKPVIGGAKPVVLKPATGVAPAPAAVPEAAAESETANKPKAVTGSIPAQAVLSKTGIVAEGLLTPAQAQAAKTKTSRISLESAIGIAPTINKSTAPMKTIRLRRPTDIPPPPGAAKPAVDAVAAAPETPVDEAKQTSADTVAAAEAKPTPPTTVTQKKTLKLQRPGFKRPTVSGLKKPVANAVQDPAVSDPVPAAADTVVDAPALADIPDLPQLSPAGIPSSTEEEVAGVPAWLNITTLIAAVAALVVMGLCTWTLYCEAAGPNAGPNDLASFHSDTDRRW